MDEMHNKSVDAGVKELLIMVDIPDGKGDLGQSRRRQRTEAVEAHYRMGRSRQTDGVPLDSGQRSLRGIREEQAKLAADGLRKLSEFAAPHDINVIVENHGGLSSDGAWLAEVMRRVDDQLRHAARFRQFPALRTTSGTTAIRASRADALRQGRQCQESRIRRCWQRRRNRLPAMMKIVVDAGYEAMSASNGKVANLIEVEGVLLTKRLLERVRDELASTLSGSTVIPNN